MLIIKVTTNRYLYNIYSNNRILQKFRMEYMPEKTDKMYQHMIQVI